MTLCKVVGTLVATQKNEHLKNRKHLIVRPIGLDGRFLGKEIIALDSVDAGVGDVVLIIQEGQGAAQILEDKKAPVHSVVVAVVDDLDVAPEG
jgi:microcompartment protein CcmK/EutM